ncbi:glycosyltransferase family 9 protein [Algibacillus agarilyticus]|uniref:glycosyltransferase family 9 protein n=1 Tax=Algibacillus agarilyticus TaxID=2234133 RepID=UPI000DCFEBE1|nr:hypothetical protein [Algibacillus agarilyticus]
MKKTNKILLIRMLSLGEIASVAVPALRYLQQTRPDSEITVLTYGAGEKIIKLAEPTVQVSALLDGFWPDEFLPAMETFLGLAEDILAVEYDEVINLDTAFMPCFLARFLKDAGEKVTGNILSMSVQSLIADFQTQALQPEFVQEQSLYLESTYFTMATWHTQWWQGAYLPDGGYPEYYLSRSCGYIDYQHNDHIELSEPTPINKPAKKVIALALAPSAQDAGFDRNQILQEKLIAAGFDILNEFRKSSDVEQQFKDLNRADLLVTLARDAFWFAKAVNCPRLLLAADNEPKMLMSEYTIETALNDINLDELIDAITEITSS